jgi:glutamyl endopeptidase
MTEVNSMRLPACAFLAIIASFGSPGLSWTDATPDMEAQDREEAASRLVSRSLLDGSMTTTAPREGRIGRTRASGVSRFGSLKNRGTDSGRDLVLGVDNRFRIWDTTVEPYTAVCHVISYFPGDLVAQGSAVMVGPNHALTAGHVLFDVDTGEWATDVLVTPAYDDGYEPFGAVYATAMHSLVGYTEYGDSNYDFGVIEFGTPIGNATGWMGYAALSASELEGSIINTAGYPGDLQDGEAMYGASGSVESVSSKQVYYRGSMDTFSGQSGSGVWMLNGTDRFVVAVHTFGQANYNGGTRITPGLFDYISYLKDPEGSIPEPPLPPSPGSVETVNVYLKGAKLLEYPGPGLDGAKFNLSYFFNDAAEDRVFDPVADGLELRVESVGVEAMRLTIPGDDPDWIQKGWRKAIWSRFIGDAWVRVTVDILRQRISLRMDWFDFFIAIDNPIAVTVASGNDYGRREGAWFQLRPWLYKY